MAYVTSSSALAQSDALSFIVIQYHLLVTYYRPFYAYFVPSDTVLAAISSTEEFGDPP